MARKLLLADDSITIQKVVELVLAEEDFEIKSVSNGEDALKIVAGFQPDIVLADIEMPKLNGYQLCDKIKSDSLTAHIPVILLAGAFEPIDEELAARVKADDSVIKPFESQELISKINSVLTISASGEEEVLAAVEESGDAGEDIFVLDEDTAEAAVPVEVEEDLWSMEEVPVVAEAEEAGLETAEEAFEIAEEALSPDLEEIPVSAPLAAPVAAPEVPAAASRPQVVQEFVMPEIVLPSKEEMLAVVEKTVSAGVSSFLASLDLKEIILASLAPAMKESVEKVLWEIAPELAEKLLKEVLKDSVSSLKGEVEKVIWETVPDLANTMISKEIEKIRAEL